MEQRKGREFSKIFAEFVMCGDLVERALGRGTKLREGEGERGGGRLRY